MFKRLVASAALAAAISAGGAGMAHSATYLINVDGCSGAGCGLSNYGTVTTTGEGTTSMGVTVSLAQNVYFNFSGHPEEAFDLANNPVIDITGLSNPPWLTFSPQAAAANSQPFFGNMDYKIDWNGTFQNAQHPGNGFPSNNGCIPGCGIQTLNFTVTPHNGSSTITPDFTTVGANHVYFTFDIARYNPTTQSVAATGHVGATLVPGAVPEPASWAMMIVGFFGMGGLLRRRRTAFAA